MKNAYAVKLMQVKAAVSNQERAAIIHRALTTFYMASAVALNQEFGFGKERIERFKQATEDIVNEYGRLHEETDLDYADGKLEQMYKQAVGLD